MGALKGRKNTLNQKLQGSKLKKDPGIPNLSQYKQKLISKEEAKKKKLNEINARQQAARQNAQNANRSLSLAEMVYRAEKQSRDFEGQAPVSIDEKQVQDAAATGQKDNSKKAYYREFRKVLENADVILEVLDARDPLGTRTRHVERMVIDSGLNKKVILVLNKIDLVPKENVEQWLKYLRNEYPAIAFKASTQSQRSHLGQSNVSTDQASENMLNSSECLGADSLVRLLKNYCRNANLKTSITVGIIGYPNVGKSSVINSLKRSKVCGVGSTPGFTKVAQQITLDKNIKLLDCPGIVFAQQGQNGQSDAEIALRNCVKVELLEDPITPVEVVVSRCATDQLMKLYNVGYFTNAHEFLVLLAQQRGKLKKGGIADVHQVARYVLQDWNGGKIPFYTVPPSAKKSHISATIVSSWGQELNLDLQTADQDVLNGLKGASEFGKNAIVMQSSDMDEDMVMDGAMEGFPVEGGMTESAMQDEGMSLKPIVQLDRVRAKKSGTSRPQLLISENEERLNPQLNQQLKKQQKAQQKKARRQQHPDGRSTFSEDEDMMQGGGYDISLPSFGSAPIPDEDEEL